ncbi:MAG: hypothetical protein FIA92_01310 [Chloroflexi bacterium]|nr:hypothetical protein [Chloroflexota bacterium]
MERLIRARVEVDPQLLLLAKAHLIDHCTGEMTAQLDAFTTSIGARRVDRVVIHPTVDVEASVDAVAQHLSATVALGEAVWALIGAGALVPLSGGNDAPRTNVEWTTVVPGSGGTSRGWRFDDLVVPMPPKFAVAPSRRARPTHLTDGDLYLATLGEGVHPLIVESLRDGVRCLRADLYLPAIAMLAKAAEEAWTLFAASLAAVAPKDAGAAKLGKDVDAGALHFAALLKRATELYARQDLFSAIAKASGASLEEVRSAREWAEVVRDSRNVLHFTVATPVPNTYEKAAALYLGAVPNLRLLFAATREANTVAAASNPGS